MLEPEDKYKVVFVGDTQVGKTCLLETYTKREFPSLEDCYSITHRVNQPLDIYWDDKLCTIHYWDTYGSVCDKMRRLTLGDAKCVVMCYAIDNPVSLRNIEMVWLQEIRRVNSLAPIVLVGTKRDLRPTPAAAAGKTCKTSKQFVSTKKGEKMQKKIGAVALVECSSLQIDSLDAVFAVVADMTEIHHSECGYSPQIVVPKKSNKECSIS